MLTCIMLDSLQKVFSDQKPEGEALNGVSLLKNERLSFQTALYWSGKNEGSFTVRVEGKLASFVKAYLVKEIPSALPVYEDRDDFYLRDTPGFYPDLLLPLNNSFTLEPEKWRSLWFELDPAGKIKAGEYDIKIIIESEDKILASEVLKAEVINADLPEQTLIHTNWFHTDCLATYYGVKVFSDEYWRITENFVKNAVRHGINMILTPLFTPPLDTKVGGERPTVQLVDVYLNNGEYSFGFDNLKKWIDMCLRCGVEYFEMSHFFTQWGAKNAPKIMAQTDKGEKMIFGWKTMAGGKKYTEFLSIFSVSLRNFLNETGVEERCFFHVSDEPSILQLRTYKARAALIERLFPGSPVIDALSDFKFFKSGAVKTPIPSSNHIEPFIGNVPELWTYYCCGQHREYVSNRFFSMPSLRNRILGLQLYKFDVKGFLQWGHNFWYSQYSIREINPFEESDAGKAFPSGDAYVVYPGEDGKPLNSLRLKVFYDALQDLRALQLLESLIGREKVIAILEEGLETSITFKEYPHEDAWLLNKRARINAEIKKAIG